MLSEEQIRKFQTLYKNRFGNEISRDEANEKGVKLIRLVELVYANHRSQVPAATETPPEI